MYGVSSYGIVPYGVIPLVEVDGGSEWQGTIVKTSLSVNNNTLFNTMGYSDVNTNSSYFIVSKQLVPSSGYTSQVILDNLPLNLKQQEVTGGYIVLPPKQSLTLEQKQLIVAAGAALPFTGLLNKYSYVLTAKQLGITAGWSSGLDVSNLLLSTKTEGVEIGGILDIQEQSLPIHEKQLYLQTGTSLSFIGEITAPTLNLASKSLSVSTGTAIGFNTTIGKASLQLSGKVLERVAGQVLNIQKDALELIYKQLSVGEQLYPVVPLERIFTLTDKNRTYLFKQTTNIFILSNKENILWL